MDHNKHTTSNAKATNNKRDSAEHAVYDEGRTADRNVSFDLPEPDFNQIGTGGKAMSDTTSQQIRAASIQYALELHRGKDRPASDIVGEASVFEGYLRDGVVGPTPPTEAPAQPTSTKMPPNA